MPRLFVVSILVLSTTLARADVDSASETAQLRARMRTEWQAVIDAPKSLRWWVDAHGRRYTGDWVVAIDGWRYFLAGGEVRCREQTGKWMSCDNEHFVTPNASVGRPATPSLVVLRSLQRGIFGRELGIVLDDGGHGHVVLETIVSTPEAAERTSRRYRAHVTVTAETFAIGEPVLVEEYRETCIAVNGCHATHWSCWRK